MITDRDLESTITAWLAGEAAAPPPAEPLARVIATTSARRPRPAVAAALGARWVGSTGIGRAAQLDRRALAGLVALGMLAIVAGAALLVGARLPASWAPDGSRPVNGWIAYTVGEQDLDIWFAALDAEPRPVVGAGPDDDDQLCPAFSPDGTSIAFGNIDADGMTALAVGDVTRDGVVMERQRVDIGRSQPPPCPVWSPDGARIALSVPRTSPVNPADTASGSGVWVVTLADETIVVLPDLLATDLAWAPAGDVLAIASGNDGITGGKLSDGRIHLYDATSADIRVLEETLGATELTWDPGGRRIAYMDGDSTHGLYLIDVASGARSVLAPRFDAIHGIGPVWSPDGASIVYQRGCAGEPDFEPRGCGGEGHVVVVVRPDDRPDGDGPAAEVVIPFQETAEGPGSHLFPFRVTWSPDSRYLLSIAWSASAGAGTALIAVPIDDPQPARVLARSGGIVAYEGYREHSTLVVDQTWGRVPPD